MPRDGSGIYSTPPGTDGGPPGATIASTPYNINVHDVEADLNAARPVIAGGTGATSAAEALFNLKGETATQIVTNYDSHLWLPGSFRSAAGATGAPNGTSAFAGTVYIGEALANPPTNQNVVVEARDLDSAVKPGLLYTRQKTAGVWSAWNYAGTGDDQTAARAAIYAAPFDAMAYNGMQVNGSFDVSQDRGYNNAIVGPASTYFCDNWISFSTGTAVTNSLVTSTGGFLSGIVNHATVTVTTAQATLTGTQFNILSQYIEGYRMARLGWGAAGAQPITIGFWTGHSRIGIYSISVRNNPDNRSYVATYTQNVANVWEYKTITVPGDTAGAWNTTNGAGIRISFVIACGPTYTAPTANNWHATTFVAAPGQINAVAFTTDQFRLSGVVILPGTQAPAAAQSSLIMRPFDQELVTCQRYWRGDINFNIDFQATAAGQNGSCTVVFNMRSTPTFTTSQIVPAVNVSAPAAVYSPVPSSIALLCTSGAAGRAYYYGNVRLDARL